MEIKNYKDLLDLPFGSSEICAREFLLRLLKIGLDAVNPFEIVTRSLQYNSVSKLLMVSNSEFDLTDKQVHVIGAGKAVGRMAEAIEKVLHGVPLSGIICVPEGVRNSLTLKKIQCVESSHPLPSEINLENTERTIEYIKEISKDDLVISLISGGGSALWSAPIPPITITDLISLNQTLLHSGMSIHEINVVRKHMSRIKGGKAARMIPSTTLILLLSDVIGDQLESIASGPFSPDTSTYHDVINLFRKYNLSKDVLPTSIYEVVTRGLNGEITETPKPKDPSFSRFHHSIIGSNNVARQAIYKAVNQVGMEVIVEDHLVDGDARIVGTNLAQLGLQISKEKSTPVLYISGGEPIVKVTGNGIGGRNQEVVAAFLREVSTFDPSLDISLISFGTDGIDGNSEYSGAICDTFTLNLFREKKVPVDCYQENNDLTNFFLQLGKSLILLGPTGTNVMDVQLLLVNSADMEQNSPLQ